MALGADAWMEKVIGLLLRIHDRSLEEKEVLGLFNNLYRTSENRFKSTSVRRFLSDMNYFHADSGKRTRNVSEILKRFAGIVRP